MVFSYLTFLHATKSQELLAIIFALVCIPHIAEIVSKIKNFKNKGNR